jgi:hypothetical protein
MSGVLGVWCEPEPPLLQRNCLANQIEELLTGPYCIYTLLLHMPMVDVYLYLINTYSTIVLLWLI